MENENPAIAIEGMTALAKYAPAAHQDLLEEMHFLSQWASKGDEIKALSNDGYWPLALFIHRLVSKQLANELEGVQQTLDRLIELDSAELIGHQSAVAYARDLHKLRHRRLEEFGVVVSNVKRAINEKKLIVRYGKPPYFPVVDEKRFCLDSWLEYKKEDPDTTWKRYPDGRLVVKITEAEAWLESIGVEQHKSINTAVAKSEKQETDRMRGYMNTILVAIDAEGIDKKNLKKYGREVKQKIRDRVQMKSKFAPSPSMFNKAWDKLRRKKEITD